MNETSINEVTINGVTYLRRDLASEAPAVKLDGMEYCIVRTYSAGVFAGYVVKREGQEVVLNRARRLWFWKGANTLSDMSQHGVTKPEDCKFSVPTDNHVVTQAIEIIPTTAKAQKSIQGVPEWKA